MRLAWLVVSVSSACFSPSTPTGVACSPEKNECPGDQACIDGVCGGRRVDGGGDTILDTLFDGPGPTNDVDGDGVTDEQDNCPTVANPQQRDKDGDAHGDACDPCPPLPSVTEPDGDGDGVGDLCDPNPQLAGDRIALFEGFYDGVPIGWDIVGAVTGSPGEVMVNSPSGSVASFGPPMLFDNRVTVSTSFSPTTYATGTHFAGAALVQPLSGALCALVISGSPNTRRMGVVDLDQQNIKSTDALAWEVGMTYRIINKRLDGDSVCTIANGSGLQGSATEGSVLDAGNASAQGYAEGVSGRFFWLMVIDSP